MEANQHSNGATPGGNLDNAGGGCYPHPNNLNPAGDKGSAARHMQGTPRLSMYPNEQVIARNLEKVITMNGSWRRSNNQQQNLQPAASITPAHSNSNWRARSSAVQYGNQTAQPVPYQAYRGPQLVQQATPANVQVGMGVANYDNSGSSFSQPPKVTVPGVYNQTVPRGFIYRGITNVAPPPSFPLMSGYQRPRAETVDSTNSQDPFVSARAVRRGCGDIRGSFSNQGGAQDGKVRYTLILPPSGFFSGRPGASEPLRNLTMNGTRLPTIEVALDSTSFPFIESCTQHVPQNYGVVKITNIPFNVKEAEIVAIIGKNSKILNDTQGPIHIIMDRPSSKTEDVYVEFYTSEDAAKCVERLQKNARNGRPPRIDGRIVAVQLVDQAELMRVLFPYAKGVDWHGCDPRVIEVGADGYEHEKFRGFLTPDEMIMLVKHVEVPGRSPFSMDVPQRPFECLMSTIKKFPWHMSKHITVGQRFQIYDATIKMVTILKAKIALAAEQRQRREQLKLCGRQQRGRHQGEASQGNHNQRRKVEKDVHPALNERLFDRIVKAAMMCPGFSVVQKDNIACCAGWGELKCSKFNQPCFANEWKHLHTLCPRPTRVPIDVLDWYIAFIREHSVEQMSSRSVQERTEAEQKSQHTSDYFGYLWAELNLPEGKELNNMTLHDLYNREVNAIQRVFARVLRRGSNAQALPESEQQ